MKHLRIYLSTLLLLSTPIGAYAHTRASVVSSIDKAFVFSCDKQQFSGAILVAMDNKVIFKQACGIASRSFNIPNNIDTKFNLGSVGKLFTAVSIAQLIQQKEFSLTTPLYNILPSWLPDEEEKRMTVGQLLNHSAGLGNFMDDKRWQLGADSGLYINTSDYKPLIQSNKLLFNPGESQAYSNNGYILLGAIIEKVTQQTYPQYLEKNVFTKAGMKNTGIYSLDEPIANRAEGYIQVCKQEKCYWKNNNYEAPFVGSSAGGAYSTVDDLFKFSQALHHQKLLNPEFSDQILSTKIISPTHGLSVKSMNINNMIIQENVSQYGFAGAWNSYGFAVWDSPSLVGHTGGVAGASAFFATSPDNKYTVIILANTGSSAPILLYKRIRSLLGFSPELINY